MDINKITPFQVKDNDYWISETTEDFYGEVFKGVVQIIKAEAIFGHESRIIKKFQGVREMREGTIVFLNESDLVKKITPDMYPEYFV
jgi:hypothetical protein